MSKLWNSFMINSVGVSDKSVALGRHWLSLGHSLFLSSNYHGGWANQCWSDQKLEICTDHWFNPLIQGLMIIWNFWFWAILGKNQLLHICNIPSKLSDWFEKRHHVVSCNFSIWLTRLIWSENSIIFLNWNCIKKLITFIFYIKFLTRYQKIKRLLETNRVPHIFMCLWCNYCLS